MVSGLMKLAEIADNYEPPAVIKSVEPVTWEQLAELEPRLRSLQERARQVRDPGGPSFCANRVWFNEFKPELLYLVGWMREKGPAVLQTSRAYDVAYRTIYNGLPDCRECGCL